MDARCWIRRRLGASCLSTLSLLALCGLAPAQTGERPLAVLPTPLVPGGGLVVRSPVLGPVLAPFGEPVPFGTSEQGVQSGHPLGATASGGVLLLDAEAAWSAFHLEHTSVFGAPPPLPPVDFSEEIVVATFAGTRPSTKSQIGVSALFLDGAGLELDVVSTEQEGCFGLAPGPELGDATSELVEPDCE